MANLYPILAVLTRAEDRRDLRAAFRGEIVFLSNYMEAFHYLFNREASLVVGERQIQGTSWKEFLQRLQHLDDAPPFVVACRLADERLWSEVLHCGGHDVVAMPFRGDEVESVLESARRERDAKLVATAA